MANTSNAIQDSIKTRSKTIQPVQTLKTVKRQEKTQSQRDLWITKICSAIFFFMQTNTLICFRIAKQVSGTEDQMERIERSLNFVSDGTYIRYLSTFHPNPGRYTSMQTWPFYHLSNAKGALGFVDFGLQNITYCNFDAFWQRIAKTHLRLCKSCDNPNWRQCSYRTEAATMIQYKT